MMQSYTGKSLKMTIELNQHSTHAHRNEYCQPYNGKPVILSNLFTRCKGEIVNAFINESIQCKALLMQGFAAFEYRFVWNDKTRE